MNSPLAKTAHTLTSKRGSWLVLGGIVVLVALLFGLLSGAGEDRPTETAPADSESTQAQTILDKFPEADKQSVMVVASNEDGSELSADDQAELEKLGGSLGDSGGDESTAAVTGPILSDDRQAALLMVPITVGLTNSDTAETVDDLRTAIADDPTAQSLTGDGMSLLVTGGPAIGADIASAFNGADFTLLIVTIVIVALLLIITYRSPVLWLLPLIVIGTADGLASTVTAAVGDWLDLQFDAGIISVLVFGAGANYALLFISRYREELRRFTDHRTALAEAWTHTATTILASNLTVVLSLLSLVFATIPGTRGLGITAAVGLLISAAAVLFALPPVLAICGKTMFWPFIPKVERAADEELTPAEAAAATRATAPASAAKPSIWRTIATRVVRKPGLHLGAGIVILGVMATGFIGSSIGLDQTEKLRVQSESAQGLDVLADHFPPGESQPIWIVADTDHADDVVDTVSDMDGVVRASAIEDTTIDGTSVTKIMVTGELEPDSAKGLELVEDIRSDVHAIDGANAQVGGAAATELDARDGNRTDFVTIVPMVLAISFIILLGILRAPIAAFTLLLVNVVSSAAAIGLGAFLSRTIFGQSALDAQVPILAFLFLVALGIDYSIFLAHRAKKESVLHGGRQGMVEAVAHTGGVITSAGIVLAGVFATLGMLPLMVLGQLGLIVGVGVLVDTIIVRTVIVPSIFGLVGDKMWWPNKVITHFDEGGVGGGTGGAVRAAGSGQADDADDSAVDSVPTHLLAEQEHVNSGSGSHHGRH
ncbi:MMPL family transporter [Brevibacterium linens]|uniref:Putative drug exporter of the RND superfamily n=1 Tax=Brevibacterium linens ATCC 9172 TaxID=1255617 RepID=A0A2H1IY24_BRELN|nr:MMPL family transporter [Brevibacterium linens]KAB1942786.1 MMPL family transporter [Brevibacterium linens ATCC 9172]SMX80103.1 putative drug exporter of the RND superfamily [Brevibacterium linens ATCC 9172]